MFFLWDQKEKYVYFRFPDQAYFYIFQPKFLLRKKKAPKNCGNFRKSSSAKSIFTNFFQIKMIKTLMERQFVKDFDERSFLHSCIIVWLVEINNVTIKGCHYYKISIMIMVLPTKLTHCLSPTLSYKDNIKEIWQLLINLFFNYIPDVTLASEYVILSPSSSVACIIPIIVETCASSITVKL